MTQGGWTEGRTEGRTDRRTHGRIHGRMDRQTEIIILILDVRELVYCTAKAQWYQCSYLQTLTV